MPSEIALLRNHLTQRAWADHRAGRLDAAAAGYRTLLADLPADADALHRLGLVAHQNGRPQHALTLIGRGIRLDDTIGAYHANLASIHHHLGQMACAVSAGRLALRHNPADAAAAYNLGNALRDLGQAGAADDSYRYALCITPGFAAAASNLGLLLKQEGAHDAAIRCHTRAIRLDPTLAAAFVNRGSARDDTPDAAIADYRTALCWAPAYEAALSNLGKAYHQGGRLSAAECLFRRLIGLQPTVAEHPLNLGTTLKDQGKFTEELACYVAARAVRPDHPGAPFNAALTHLLLGDFARGWPGYEWRWQHVLGPHGHAQPRWDGRPFSGQTLLLHAEQGFGDTLQFCRYIPPVVARGGTVIVEVQAPLKSLVQAFVGPQALVVGRGEPLPTIDLQCPLLSLPGLFGTDLTTIPPPLTVPPAIASRAIGRHRPQPRGGLRVGIAWQGNVDYRGDRARSVPLACFYPLAAVPGVRLLSLQKQVGLDQLAHLPTGVRIETSGADDDASDFAATAAVIAGLDLVITIDSAVAHLAASLGCPVWIALPAIPDWRWLLDRSDTPWYPSARLFRQTTRGVWDDVFARMADELVSRSQRS